MTQPNDETTTETAIEQAYSAVMALADGQSEDAIQAFDRAVMADDEDLRQQIAACEARTMTQPYYPDVHVLAWHENEHAYVILHRVRQAFRRGGIPTSAWDEFYVEATSGGYDHLLRTVMDWVTVDDEEDDNE